MHIGCMRVCPCLCCVLCSLAGTGKDETGAGSDGRGLLGSGHQTNTAQADRCPCAPRATQSWFRNDTSACRPFETAMSPGGLQGTVPTSTGKAAE